MKATPLQQKISEITDNRAVSPVVGAILVVGLVVIAAITISVFGGFLLDSPTPQSDSNFAPNVEIVDNNGDIDIEYSVFYTEGPDFDSSNTVQLHLEGETANGDRIPPIILYQDGSTTANTSAEDLDSITEGSMVLTPEAANDSSVSAETSLDVVWTTEDGNEEITIVIDQVVFPAIGEIVEGQDISTGDGGTGESEVEFGSDDENDGDPANS